MAYEAEISRKNKALLVFLIDQSGSMEDPSNEGSSKAQRVADVLNDVLNTIVRDASGREFKDRFDIALVGYGSNVDSAFQGTLAGQKVVSLTELKDNALTTSEEGPTFVDACHAKGGTNMYDAFKYVHQIVSEWASANPNNFPPTVIHITDAENTGVDPTEVIEQLKEIKTSDGATMLWNIHISGNSGASVMMPSSSDGISDPLAMTMLQWSSILPESSEHFKGHAGKYAFAYNAKISDLIKCLSVGTRHTR